MKEMKSRCRPAGLLAAVAALAALAAAPSGALAQTLPPGVHLGMTADELQAAGLDLQRVRRPERMPGGALGVWSQAGQVGDDDMSFDVTYFMRGPVLDRVELVMTSAREGVAASYERVVGVLRGQFGAELRSRSPAGTAVDETASWAAEGEDVAVYMTGAKDAAKVRVIYKRRTVKDASTL
jgi:hypothetical protein